MKTEERSNTIAAVGTIAVVCAVFAMLWFLYINVPPQTQDDGVEVMFLEEEFQPESPEVEQPSQAAESAPSLVEATPKVASPKPQVEPLMTQEQEEALEMARREKEKERKQNEAIAKAQQMGALFGKKNTDEVDNGVGGQGIASTANPLSKGKSGNGDWSLNGRYLVGSLPQPAATFNQEGKVVVFITVNKEGYVVSARAGQGTTISDESTRQLAVKAAMKAQFNMVDHPNAAIGTITYYFKFK